MAGHHSVISTSYFNVPFPSEPVIFFASLLASSLICATLLPVERESGLSHKMICGISGREFMTP